MTETGNGWKGILEPGERIELRPRIDSAIVDVDIVERSTRRR